VGLAGLAALGAGVNLHGLDGVVGAAGAFAGFGSLMKGKHVSPQVGTIAAAKNRSHAIYGIPAGKSMMAVFRCRSRVHNRIGGKQDPHKAGFGKIAK
jgi:hypothetical protein